MKSLYNSITLVNRCEVLNIVQHNGESRKLSVNVKCEKKIPEFWFQHYFLFHSTSKTKSYVVMLEARNYLQSECYTFFLLATYGSSSTRVS